MGRRYEDKLVTCPFFMRQDATRIACEGSLSVVQVTCVMEFNDGASKRAYMKMYCCDRWSECEHAVQVDRKYQ